MIPRGTGARPAADDAALDGYGDQRLEILDRAGLVREVAPGREKHYQINDAQLSRAGAQVNALSGARPRRTKHLVESIARTEKDSPTSG